MRVFDVKNAITTLSPNPHGMCGNHLAALVRNDYNIVNANEPSGIPVLRLTVSPFLLHFITSRLIFRASFLGRRANPQSGVRIR